MVPYGCDVRPLVVGYLLENSEVILFATNLLSQENHNVICSGPCPDFLIFLVMFGVHPQVLQRAVGDISI